MDPRERVFAGWQRLVSAKLMAVIVMNEFLFLFRKVKYIFCEMLVLIKQHRYYFFAPLFFLLAIIAFFVYYVGPSVVIAFIYAGV